MQDVADMVFDPIDGDGCLLQAVNRCCIRECGVFQITNTIGYRCALDLGLCISARLQLNQFGHVACVRDRVASLAMPRQFVRALV